MRCLVSDHNRSWDLILLLPTVNKSICMSPFEVVNGYKLRKLADLLLVSLNARVSKSVESFTYRVYDLHVEIVKQMNSS